MNKVLIKSGKLINPATNFEGIVDISIEDGLIKEKLLIKYLLQIKILY